MRLVSPPNPATGAVGRAGTARAGAGADAFASFVGVQRRNGRRVHARYDVGAGPRVPDSLGRYGGSATAPARGVRSVGSRRTRRRRPPRVRRLGAGLLPRRGARSAGRAGRGDPPIGAHDEAHLRAFEDGLRLVFDEFELHRRDPLLHVENLDLACYDRAYAPPRSEAAARRAHLARWPEAIEMAVIALTWSPPRSPRPCWAPTRAGRRPRPGPRPVEAPPWPPTRASSRTSSAPPAPATRDGAGGPALARLMGVGEAMEVDLATLADLGRPRARAAAGARCARLCAPRPASHSDRELVPRAAARPPRHRRRHRRGPR